MSGKESQAHGSKEVLDIAESRRAFRRFIVGITGVALLGVAYVARLYWVSPENVEAQQKPAQFRAPQTQSRITQSTNPSANTTARQTQPKPATTANRATTANATAPASTSSKSSGTKPLKVVAQVNGENITRNQLAQACLDRYGKETLEGYLNKRLIKQACEKHQIVITEELLDKEIERMAKKFGMSVDRWLTMLQQERNIAPDQYRNEHMWINLALRQLASQEIEVTPEQLAKAFESEFGPKVKVRLIAHSNLATITELRKQALANPDEFGALAKEHSEDQASASARGLIPPIGKHVGDASLEAEAFSLKEGDISQLVKIANQYILMKCEKRIPSTYIAPQFKADAEARLRDQIRERNLESAAGSIFQRLQAEAKIQSVYKDASLKESHPGVVAILNGQQITVRELAEECITRYGIDVLQGEINRMLLTQALTNQNKEVSQEDILSEIKRAADSRGYIDDQGNPDVQTWLEAITSKDNVTVDIYVKDAVWPTVALKQLVSDQVQITEDDLQKGFESNYGKRVEVMAIVLNTQRQANMVWDLANNNSTDYFFGQLAEQYSIEPVSRANQGKVPPIRKNGGQPVVEEEAFRLKKGELSGIVAVGGKYIIMRCTGHTVPVVESIEDVKEELIDYLSERKVHSAMNVTFDDIRQRADVINFLRPIIPAGASAPASSTGTPQLFQK
ncbi:MAG: peptidylprolyl isomerase [Rhodopirellula sp.]|nr:peptidylprolyl isomerase [Rhodopirellula sp.]|tara:strand:+ start:78663 stop:80708 length:2046 start_codon:yes stop_codon:yes gene_type:complete